MSVIAWLSPVNQKDVVPYCGDETMDVMQVPAEYAAVIPNTNNETSTLPEQWLTHGHEGAMQCEQ